MSYSGVLVQDCKYVTLHKELGRKAWGVGGESTECRCCINWRQGGERVVNDYRELPTTTFEAFTNNYNYRPF